MTFCVCCMQQCDDHVSRIRNNCVWSKRRQNFDRACIIGCVSNSVSMFVVPLRVTVSLRVSVKSMLNMSFRCSPSLDCLTSVLSLFGSKSFITHFCSLATRLSSNLDWNFKCFPDIVCINFLSSGQQLVLFSAHMFALCVVTRTFSILHPL